MLLLATGTCEILFNLEVALLCCQWESNAGSQQPKLKIDSELTDGWDLTVSLNRQHGIKTRNICLIQEMEQGLTAPYTDSGTENATHSPISGHEVNQTGLVAETWGNGFVLILKYSHFL